MLTDSRVIPMNSRTLEGQKVLLRVIGMFKSSNKVRTQHRAVAQREDDAGWAKKSHQKYEQWTI